LLLSCFDKSIILGATFMLNVIDRPQPQSIPQPVIVAEPEATYTLTYRGTAYELPVHKAPTHTPDEVAQLMGKRLTYRGTTYVMVPASVSALSAPKVAHQLCYRGVTYTSFAKPNLSGIDYVAL
jgi:hypothetical protein